MYFSSYILDRSNSFHLLVEIKEDLKKSFENIRIRNNYIDITVMLTQSSFLLMASCSHLIIIITLSVYGKKPNQMVVILMENHSVQEKNFNFQNKILKRQDNPTFQKAVQSFKENLQIIRDSVCDFFKSVGSLLLESIKLEKKLKNILKSHLKKQCQFYSFVIDCIFLSLTVPFIRKFIVL
ncbi:unnamed protein product [Paramecium octaurelia]|uniref:Transmembrane protein n=1 Tax=Paramecium octaurelia TaxID=43137 RepID=A0A8S1SMF5_PAROT|nr:unnamed protein product [Paramecium octaurelia]